MKPANKLVIITAFYKYCTDCKLLQVVVRIKHLIQEGTIPEVWVLTFLKLAQNIRTVVINVQFKVEKYFNDQNRLKQISGDNPVKKLM